MKRFLRPLIALLVVIAVIAAIGANVRRAAQKPVVVPRTAAVHRGDIRLVVSETGTVEPVGKVDVKSKVAGRLLSIPIQEGQFVRQGQLIATVDRTLLDPQIARTQAQLTQAQARYQQAIAQYQLQVAQTRMSIRQAQSGVDTAVASLHTAQAHLVAVKAGARPQTLAEQTQAVQRAQIALADAIRTQKRKQSLVEKGFLAQQELDSAQTAVDTAESSLATAQQEQALTQAGPRIEDVRDAASQVDAQKAQVAAQKVALASAQANAGNDAVRHSDVDQAKASVDQIAGDLAQLMVQVGDTRILAPASGVVLKKYKERTEIVQSATSGFSDAQAIVATLGDRPRVLVGINEVDIAKVRVGMPVEVRVDAVPGEVLQGKVMEIAPASTNAFDSTGSTSSSGSGISKFSVKVGFARYDGRLRSGMSAQVDIISAQKHSVLLLPLEAVAFPGKQGEVSVLVAGNKQEKKTVVLGLRNETEAEVVSGLADGDKVVIPPINGKDRRKIDIQSGP